MQRHHVCWLLPAALAWATAAATAQAPASPPGATSAPSTTSAPGTTTAPPSPAPAAPHDTAAKVPPLVYRSALATFRRLGESEPLPWREANDRVGRIGGWRAYAREANAPEAPASAAPAVDAASMPMPMPISKPTPGPHGAHKPH